MTTWIDSLHFPSLVKDQLLKFGDFLANNEGGLLLKLDSHYSDVENSLELLRFKRSLNTSDLNQKAANYLSRQQSEAPICGIQAIVKEEKPESKQTFSNNLPAYHYNGRRGRGRPCKSLTPWNDSQSTSAVFNPMASQQEQSHITSSLFPNQEFSFGNLMKQEEQFEEPSSTFHKNDPNDKYVVKLGNLKISRFMGYKEIEELLRDVLLHPGNYTKNLNSFHFDKTLGYCFQIFKRRALFEQPDSAFECQNVQEEEERAINDPRLARTREKVMSRTMYIMTPRFFELFDLEGSDLNQTILKWQLKFNGAQIGFLPLLNQSQLRRNGTRTLRFYCEFKSRIINSNADRPRNYQEELQPQLEGENDDSDQEVPISRRLIYQNCGFRLLYKCDVDNKGNDITTYKLVNYSPSTEHRFNGVLRLLQLLLRFLRLITRTITMEFKLQCTKLSSINDIQQS
ncbi:hypothetical protein FGO68_gene4661 [Halteria grandinella]|uniref:Uncharacterized protein n=1 Tax=Halteria grandinella TaxID=5974 RepID=A0A8J8P065_HALGN|nr:hypothetical protein FGO68_gene4661 [Halteria grandinella]